MNICFLYGDWEYSRTRNVLRWMIKVCSIWLVWFDYVIILCLYSIHLTAHACFPSLISAVFCRWFPQPGKKPLGGLGNGERLGSILPPNWAVLAARQWQHARSKRLNRRFVCFCMRVARSIAVSSSEPTLIFPGKYPEYKALQFVALEWCQRLWRHIGKEWQRAAFKKKKKKNWGKIAEQCNYVYDAALVNIINRLACFDVLRVCMPPKLTVD